MTVRRTLVVLGVVLLLLSGPVWLWAVSRGIPQLAVATACFMAGTTLFVTGLNPAFVTGLNPAEEASSDTFFLRQFGGILITGALYAVYMAVLLRLTDR